jgi:hypothetical protein
MSAFGGKAHCRKLVSGEKFGKEFAVIPVRVCRARPNLLNIYSSCTAKPLDNLNQKVTASHSSYDSPGTTNRSRNGRSNPGHVRDCRASLRRLSG